MDSDQNNKYRIVSISDCQGTCKTPIGCTCKVQEEIPEGEEILETVEASAGAQQTSVGEKKVVEKVSGGCGSGGSCGCGSSGSGSSSSATSGSKCNGCSNMSSSCCAGRNKLEVYDWLNDIPAPQLESQMIEVQFKNTRKGYFLNSNNLEIYRGDIVAVEATPGHDIGEVTLTGKLVQLQMRKNNYRGEVKRIYRVAKQSDIDKSNEAKAKEQKTMIRARQLAEELELNMKISDVEYQGDANKAIFYYIADERVDFRQLIKVYASEFRVKIEMKQIGARQEAGRVGGIGPCGRELCCSSSMSNFVSVSTSAARLQDIPLNPQKLAGQCGKLKCCLNFEVDVYVEAQKGLPSREAILDTKDSSYYHFKTDILSGMMSYSTVKYMAANLITIPKERVFEVIQMNRKGNKPLALRMEDTAQEEKKVSHDLLDQDINRFDSEKGDDRRNNRNRNNKKKKPLNGDNKPSNGGTQSNNGGESSVSQNRPERPSRPSRPNNNGASNNPNNQGQKPNNNQNRPSITKPNNGEAAVAENGNKPEAQNNPSAANKNKKRRNRPPRNNEGKAGNQQSE